MFPLPGTFIPGLFGLSLLNLTCLGLNVIPSEKRSVTFTPAPLQAEAL